MESLKIAHVWGLKTVHDGVLSSTAGADISVEGARHVHRPGNGALG
jgi:hypothetical protein